MCYKSSSWLTQHCLGLNLLHFCLQGERETNELNNKLAQFSENAMKFTMDGGLSAYDYKAEEDAAEADINFKRLAGTILPTLLCSAPCAFYEQTQQHCTMPSPFSPQTSSLSMHQAKQPSMHLIQYC